MSVLILIPAAGASRRMRGRDKLLEEIGGTAILRRAAEAAVATGEPVLVTLPDDDGGPRHVALTGAGVTRLAIDGTEGMAASIRAGAMAAQRAGAEGLLVMLPDMPEIDTGALLALLAAWRAEPARPCRAAAADGTPGNPVLIPAALLPALVTISGDTGAREVLAAAPPRLCPLPGRAALIDLDTPEAWAEWRRAKASDGDGKGDGKGDGPCLS